MYLSCNVNFSPPIYLFITSYNRQEDTVGRKDSCHLMDSASTPASLAFAFLVHVFLQFTLEEGMFVEFLK